MQMGMTQPSGSLIAIIRKMESGAAFSPLQKFGVPPLRFVETENADCQEAREPLTWSIVRCFESGHIKTMPCSCTNVPLPTLVARQFGGR
jgi:hypothetical protein